MKRIQHLLLIIGIVLACFNTAEAHAFLAHAEPKVGSTVKASPAAVKIWFTMEVQADRSGIEVFNAAGKEIDQKDAKVDAKDKALMSVSVPSLPSGTYKVMWHAVCPFGHHTSGTFNFEIAAP